MSARSASSIGDGGLSRRQLLRRVWGTAFGLFVLQTIAAFVSFFWPTRVSGFGGKVVAGKLSQFQIGMDPITSIEGKFFLVRIEDGILAYYRKCPHLGCIVPPWEKAHNRFNCGCHGSLFDIKGEVIGGPAPRPLDLMKVEIVGDTVIVDTGQITERRTYDPSQAVKA